MRSLEERRQRRLSGKERVRWTPNTQASKWKPSHPLPAPSPDDVGTTDAIPAEPPKPEVDPKWRRHGKPVVEIIINDEYGQFARTLIPKSKIGAWAQFMQEHYEWLEEKEATTP